MSQSAYLTAYEAIRDQILNGEIPRGQKLTEDKLASELGVSRTPVREAIRKLEEEGLIKKKKVVNPSETDLRNIFHVRSLLEGDAARSAAEYLSEEKLIRLKECVKIGRNGTVDEIMAANKDFHEIIVQSSNNPFMADVIERMNSIIYLFRKTVVYHNRPFLIDEHEKIYDAILKHQPDQAEELMKKHLRADLEFCLRFIRVE
ncbi:GntR family transcriptional regulator [Salinibacillus xinjiangensis]|uniref:GntR family transcriptional regulator n=1 Tax=Salinibacillus xinjiangensis TaxID=1229268 RepID=UPI002B275720|nr:GntR family transcriptional regulator [Salinibacillus xinjiangensis]